MQLDQIVSTPLGIGCVRLGQSEGHAVDGLAAYSEINASSDFRAAHARAPTPAGRWKPLPPAQKR